MTQKVYISGIGSISSIGFNVQQTLESLLNKKTGIAPISILDTRHNGTMLAGEIKATNSDLLKILNYQQSNKFTRTSLLGIIAAREALQDSGIDLHDGLKTGLVSSTSVGGIDTSEKFFKDYLKDPNAAKLRLAKTHDCGDSTENIALDLGIKDFITTISTACSSSANAIMFGARLIKNKVVDRVIVGGTDALTKYTLNGFNALKILDQRFCKPFDEDRNGLNLGEGAAYLMLESEDSLLKRGKRPLGELIGFGNANDAYHQTASSPEGIGAYYAMKKAMRTTGLDTYQIDYINAHGTATPINDLSEGTAIKNLFKDYIPKFSSTKSFTGHTLAASGAIEAIIVTLMMQHNFVVPNLNFENAIKDLDIKPVILLEKDIQTNTVLSNSFGFGGNCSSLVFSRFRA